MQALKKSNVAGATAASGSMATGARGGCSALRARSRIREGAFVLSRLAGAAAGAVPGAGRCVWPAARASARPRRTDGAPAPGPCAADG
jgi:hypothetical protein